MAASGGSRGKGDGYSSFDLRRQQLEHAREQRQNNEELGQGRPQQSKHDHEVDSAFYGH